MWPRKGDSGMGEKATKKMGRCEGEMCSQGGMMVKYTGRV